jgi:hypothetical protein
MKHKRNWVIGIILSAAAAFAALQSVSAPTHEVETPEAVATITGTVGVDNSASCGYAWAYHDDPELTAKVDEAVQILDSTASANVQQYGEDCVYADGHSTFNAMETDFYVRLPAEDLADEEDFGNWIKQVMDIITSLPDNSIQGKKGFVEFSFIKTDTVHVVFRVDITEYLTAATNLSGSELFQRFSSPPTTSTP